MTPMLDLLAKVARDAKAIRDLERENEKKMAKHQHREEEEEQEQEENTETVPLFFPKECRRSRTRRNILGAIRMTEEGPCYTMFNDLDHQDNDCIASSSSHNEVLRIERSTESMECIETMDDEKEDDSYKIQNFFHNSEVYRLPGSNIVIREGVGGNEPKNQKQVKPLKLLLKKRPPPEENRGVDKVIKKLKVDHQNVSDGKPEIKIFKKGKMIQKTWGEKDQKDQRNIIDRKKEGEDQGDGDSTMISKKRRRITNKPASEEQNLPPPPIPETVMAAIRQRAEARGEAIDEGKVVLVIQKPLTPSDVARQQNRLSAPFSQLRNDFLTAEEAKWLKVKDGSYYNSIDVPIIEPRGVTQTVPLRQWAIGTKKRTSFVLNGDWKNIVENNGLQAGHVVQLWAFRIGGQLNFAFVILPKEEDASSALQAAGPIIGPGGNGGDAGDNSDEYMASSSEVGVQNGNVEADGNTSCLDKGARQSDEGVVSTLEGVAKIGPSDESEDASDDNGDEYVASTSQVIADNEKHDPAKGNKSIVDEGTCESGEGVVSSFKATDPISPGDHSEECVASTSQIVARNEKNGEADRYTMVAGAREDGEGVVSTLAGAIPISQSGENDHSDECKASTSS